MSVPIGIDLGTTNTVVAAVIAGRAVTLEDEHKSRLIPSIVSFHPSGSVLVGAAGRDRRLIDSSNTIFSIKRLIGRPWKSAEVQQAIGRFPFDLREGPKETTMVVARGEHYALPEISAFVLRRAKQIAEAQLGETVDKAVITVPANFNDLQRAATKVAGKLAGLEVLRILNEPTAAALAYGQSIAESERIAIFDLGGGTFDITLLDLSGSVFEVLATAGDTALGGDDVDVLIADRMSDQFVQIHRFDPRTNSESFAKLRIAAESLKIRLSTEMEASVELNEIGYGEGGAALSIRFRMTRAELEHLARDLLAQTIDVTRFAIETIGQKKDKFDRVILVGGATRMPLVARKVEEYFAKPPYLKVNPDEVVALGAAIQAYSLDRSAKKKAPTRKTMAVGAAPPGQRPEQKPDPLPSVKFPAVPTLMHAVVTAAPSSARQLPGQRTHSMDDEPTGSTLLSLPRGASVEAPLSVTLSMPGAPQKPAPKAPPLPPEPPPMAPGARAKSLSRPDTPSMSFDLPELPDQNTGSFNAPVMAAPPPAPVGAHAAPPASPPPVAAPQRPAPAPLTQGGRPAPLDARGKEILLELPKADRSDRINFSTVEPRPAEHRAPPAEHRAPPVEHGAPPASFNSGGVAAHRSPLLIDVTPLSLSVETVAGWCDILITANSPVPCDRTRVFLTAADGQTVVHVRVAQGESRRFGENTYLGELELSGLHPAPRGETKIAVTFEIDADGILNVKAADELTGRETQSKMKLLGAQTDAIDVAAMLARQARHAVS